ncbi:hypothetical protein [Tardiphaga robiniae]|uniref:Uncharacterized protein n=1 Tax=Tardiphaga robiniae TaxID=943830 RepID=A0A163Y6H6_9BRAD|nr:hypothetical protein [Tardiphaga robiniae]KZD21866.1 hypothetical protein A4A58_12180 [Tardiphaga robiniae]
MPYPFAPLFDPRIRVIDSSAEPVTRLRVTDDVDNGPPPVAGGRPKGSKRPHTNATVAGVRRLIEETTLTHREIAARMGVANGTVAKWTRDFGWQRHPFAPAANDKMPTARAGRRLKLRMLGNKLHLLAERCAAELWSSPSVDLDRLIQAMQVLKMARLEYMGNRRPRRRPDGPARTGQDWIDRDTAIRTALKEMRRGGVNIDRIPDEAMALLEDAHTPPEREHPALRPRGPRRRV